jgi:transposase
MQGLHVFDPQATTIIDLESFVHHDHFLRKVDRVLESAFVRELTAARYAAGRGRPSIDPEVYFRMLLVAFLYDIRSDRQLCEDVYYNLAYRWFCRLSLQDRVPDHSSLSRIRDRYGEDIFEALFRRIVEICRTRGLVAPQCRVMTDATLIAADAALDSLVHNDPEQARLEAESLQGRTKAVDPLPTRKISNQTHRSRTDPDATLAQKRGTPQQLKYKVHQSAEAESRVILDTHVTTGARHDNQPYLEQLQRIEERHRITIHEVTADRGYGSAHIIRTLQEQGKQTFIPLWSGRVGNSKYLKGSLVYQKDHDRFRCPAGKYLTPTPAITENHKRYVSLSSDCQACAQASTCPARTSGSSPQRFVLRNLDQDLFEEVQARMRDPAFGAKLSERMWKIEGLFAEAKRNHGLSRARYRGRTKVQIQAYLSAIVQNLKRLVAALWCWLITQSLNRCDTITPTTALAKKPTYSTGPVLFRNVQEKARVDDTCDSQSPPQLSNLMAIALGGQGVVLQRLGRLCEAAVALRQSLGILEGMKSRETRAKRIPAGH